MIAPRWHWRWRTGSLSIRPRRLQAGSSSILRYGRLRKRREGSRDSTTSNQAADTANQTGPTSAMLFTFLPAAIQTVANFVGTVPGTNNPCALTGPIVCVVRFGTRQVDYLTYL